MRFFTRPTVADLRRPSVIALLAANLVPVVGVLFFGWEIFPLMFLFWSENVIVGIFNVLKMLVAMPFKVGILPMIPFFCVHYGIFTFVHGIFVVELFGGHKSNGDFPDPARFWQIMQEHQLGWAVLGLAVSRGISFVSNYLRQQEFRRVEPAWLMWQPYGRIIVLHLALIGGGFLVQTLHSPVLGLLLLVALKTALDLAGHLRERSRFSELPVKLD